VSTAEKEIIVPMLESRFEQKPRTKTRWREIHASLDKSIKNIVPAEGITLDDLYIELRKSIGVRHSGWICLNDIAECARAVGMKIEGIAGLYITWKPSGHERVVRV
jgi:hypothetical protein